MPFVPKPPDDDEEVFLGCYRISEIKRPYVIAVERPCVKCNSPVWVAISSFTLIEKQGAQPICMECLETTEIGEYMEPTAEQMIDLASYSDPKRRSKYN